MTVSERLDLSSCTLCGRPLSGDGVVREYGGLESEVHPACADDGLEGKDLDSPHGDPDEAAEPTGSEADGDSVAAGPDPPSGGEVDEEEAETPSEAVPSRESGGDGGADAGDGVNSGNGERATGSGQSSAGNPEWTRISDFT